MTTIYQQTYARDRLSLQIIPGDGGGEGEGGVSMPRSEDEDHVQARGSPAFAGSFDFKTSQQHARHRLHTALLGDSIAFWNCTNSLNYVPLIS